MIARFLLAGALMALAGNAMSADYPCPPSAKSCKVITLTPDEEFTLTGPDMIFDHAVWANRVKFDSMANAWREKLRQAPAGTVEPPKAEEPKK